MLKTCDPLQLPHGSVLSVPGLGVLRGEDSRGLAAALHLQVGRLFCMKLGELCCMFYFK